MAQSGINLTEGSGKRIHTWDQTISSTLYQDQFVVPGEYPVASYVAIANNTSIATGNDHVLQLMAGASLHVRIRRIVIIQATAATTAAVGTFEILRLTTAGTGGTAVTPAKFDTTDSASGATAMTLPSSKGTESTLLLRPSFNWRQTAPTGGGMNTVFEWTQMPNGKPIVIAAGTSNGLALKVINAIAAATVNAWIEFVEVSYAV